MAEVNHNPQASTEAWTTRRLLAWMGEAFTKAGLDSARLQSEMLLAHVIGCPRLRLFTEPERPATEDERSRLRGLVARALRHEPIDYLVGERSFFGLLFHVDRRVLVPRPSTETIVEHVLQEARKAGRNAEGAEGDVESAERGARAADGAGQSSGHGAHGVSGDPGERVFDVENREASSVLSAFKPAEEDLEEEDEASLEKPRPAKRANQGMDGPSPAGRVQGSAAHASPRRGTPVARRARVSGPAWRIADICTGSGCIAVALAKNLPGCTLVASDISREALDVARSNAARHNVANRVTLVEGDLAAPLRQRGPFDIIVSNPPYIPDDEWADVAPNVKDHEPEIALRGGADGMKFIRQLLAQAPGLLVPGGILLIEIAASRADEVLALALPMPLLEGAAILRDCDNLPRVLLARRRHA